MKSKLNCFPALAVNLVPITIIATAIFALPFFHGCTKQNSSKFEAVKNSDLSEQLKNWKSLTKRERNLLAKKLDKTKALVGWNADELVGLMGTPDSTTTPFYEKGSLYFGYSAADNESVCDLNLRVDSKDNKVRSTELNINN